ncbi:MAG TPA: hypothetical protein P5279_14205 [Anaerohalosphaeraceae bacterium]|jgi:hypothetical protein|nr:hypothetical protein [Anaerohalosphaeraceae bacterium]HRT51640.1 hypothetical protein [Anaerohalosphaeraceae bacterium]HRT87349.1 hypothetical protein [Anaerohalosphaeraceae bacterium]
MGYGLYALIGAVLGGGLVWLIYDIKAKRIIDDLQKRLGIAEAENQRIGPLEQQLADAKTHNAELQEQVAELKADVAQKAETIASLKAELVAQAKAAKNKLSMLNDVQGRFCQALATLAETALNCDNDEFIRVMEVNVTAFEKSLLEDIGKWQTRDHAVTQEVCDVAEREQGQMPLSAQDEVMEGLVAVDDGGGKGAEPAGPVKPVDENLAVIDDPANGQAGEAPSEDAGEVQRLADETADTAEDDAALRLVEEDAEAADASNAPAADDEAAAAEPETPAAVPEGNGGVDAALNEDKTADAVANLEEQLERELALELEDSPEDEELKLDFGESGEEDAAQEKIEIGAADGDASESAPSLKFPILEIPADADSAAVEDAGKKKLNSESESLAARREAV